MKLSVIVPTYNASKVLVKCIQSILTNKSVYEVIIVDDGSRDDTCQIAQSLSADKRVVLIQQKNSGPAVARINGVQNASGDFVAFVDSDDYLNDNAFDEIVQKNDLSDIDILVFGWIRKNSKGQVISQSGYKKSIVSGAKCASYYIKQNKISNFLWDKIYRKSLFDGVNILPLYYAEDAYILSQIFLKAKKAAVTQERYYNYIVNENSLVNRPYNIHSIDNITAWQNIRTLYEGNPDLLPSIDIKLCSLSIILYSSCPNEDKQLYLDLFKKYRANVRFIDIIKNGSLKRKVMILLFPNFPKFVEKQIRK